MPSPLALHSTRHRGRPRLVMFVFMLALAGGLFAAVPLDVAAGQTWTARIGAGGTHGTASFATGTAASGAATYRLGLSLRRLRARTTYGVTVRRGTCATLGRLVATLPSIRTGSTGAANRNTALTASTGRAIRSALGAGRAAIRVGTHCGVFPAAPAVMPRPTPSPMPVPTLGPGLGVPVVDASVGSLVVLAVEPWTDPAAPPASGNSFVTLELLAQGSAGALLPARFVLQDSGGGGHVPLSQGRSPEFPTTIPGWLTFELPAGLATDVKLIWSPAGTEYRIPLHVEAPDGSSSVRLTYDGTPTAFAGGTIADAVGTPTGYIAVGYVQHPPITGSQMGAVWTSVDGSRWQIHQPATFTDASLAAIARGATGRLVAVGSTYLSDRPQQAMWTSDDEGRTWTRVEGLPTDLSLAFWRDVSAFGHGFVVAGSIHLPGDSYPHAASMVSADGRTWTRSTFVEGANNHAFGGLVPTPDGIVGFGECGEEFNGAAVWHSSNGDRWQRTLDDCQLHPFNGGGAEPVQMELVFATTSRLVGFASATEYGAFPRVFESLTGTAWTRLAIGGAMSGFVPSSATGLKDGSYLLTGRSLEISSTAGLGVVAWQYTLDGRWLQATVDQPVVSPGAGIDTDIVALVPGPAGVLAVGNRVDRSAPYQQDGVSWHVVEP